MAEGRDYEDLMDFLRSRAPWLRVMAVDGDVVLRIDGTYSPPGYVASMIQDGAEIEAAMGGGAEGMADYFREQLEPLLVEAGLADRCQDWRAGAEA